MTATIIEADEQTILDDLTEFEFRVVCDAAECDQTATHAQLTTWCQCALLLCPAHLANQRRYLDQSLIWRCSVCLQQRPGPPVNGLTVHRFDPL